MVKVTAKPAAEVAAPAAGAVATAPKAPKEARKKRSDFATWAEFCDYKKSQVLARIPKLQAKAEDWEKRKTEPMDSPEAKLQKKLAKTTASVAALIAQLQGKGVPIPAEMVAQLSALGIKQ